ASESKYIDIYEVVLDTLVASKRTQVVEYIYNIAYTKDEILIALDFMEIILRDVLEFATGGSNYVTINNDYCIEKIAKDFSKSPGGISRAIFNVIDAKYLYVLNISPMNIIEQVIFDILEIQKTC
ncbi:MAG: hypothetical protein LBE09_08580, partial [Christensenellaceae bacterium]|nr:hypothetical protein [Christensenellaceae bacterium]